jgi:hypothetical protein
VEWRVVINVFDQCASKIRRCIFARGRLFDRSTRPGHAGCPIQQRLDIQTDVSSELQMLLMQSGGLMAEPRIAEIGIRRG